jgi:hypothetical protein
MVVTQAIGAQHDAAAAELGVALGDGLEVGPAAHLARQQHDRQLLGGIAARRRAQRMRQLERDAGVGRRVRTRASGDECQRGGHRRESRRRHAEIGARATQQGRTSAEGEPCRPASARRRAGVAGGKGMGAGL